MVQDSRIGRLQSDGGWFVGWMDPGNFLAALHYTSDVPVGCPSAPKTGYMDVQFVFNPKDQEVARWIGNYMGKAWLIVVDLRQAGDCQGWKLLASGWGKLHITDDDALATEPSGHHNPDSWGGWPRAR